LQYVITTRGWHEKFWQVVAARLGEKLETREMIDGLFDVAVSIYIRFVNIFFLFFAVPKYRS